MKTGQMVKSFYGHNDFIRKIKMMPDGKIITCSDDKTVRIWDFDTGEIINTFEGH